MNGCLGNVHGLSLPELEALAAESEDECTVAACQMAIAEWHRHNEALKGADGRVSFGSISAFMKRHAGGR